MAPVDKSTDGSDSTDNSGTALPSKLANVDKTVGGDLPTQIFNKSRKPPILQDESEWTNSSKQEDTQGLSKFIAIIIKPVVL